MDESYIGEVMLWAGDFAPKNWAFCNGQLLSIAQNQALFAILGTTYGGDGRNTFALPDLRGRAVVHQGSGPGLSPVVLGQMWGSTNNTLTMGNLPAHTHTVTSATIKPMVCNVADEETEDPVGNFLRVTTGINTYASTANGLMGAIPFSPQIQVAGGSQPINNMQPTLVMNYCICLYGIFPTRN